MGSKTERPPGDGGIAPPADVRSLLRFAWPSILSFVAGSLFRVNDQFWVQHLGPDAQEALGAVTFLLILDFAAYFVAIAGSMSLISRASGAGDRAARDELVGRALFVGAAVGVLVGLFGYLCAEPLADALELAPSQRQPFIEYTRAIHLWSPVLALAPLVSNIFLSMGDSRTPLLLQIGAVVSNFALNPLFIYELGMGEDLIVGERWGMAGAAHASGASRGLAVTAGLTLLAARWGIHWWRVRQVRLAHLTPILRTGIPSAGSIAVYAVVYALIVKLVFSELPPAALGGLSIGFNAFEGVAYPFYLGVAVATASVVGRNLGAGDPARARQAIRNARGIATALGLVFTAVFLGLGSVLVDLFTMDPMVQMQALDYVHVLAVSQVFVALEAVEEKVLLGVGKTRPIFWVSVPGNAIRLPLAWLLAVQAGLGAAGVWWTINLSTLLKAAAFHLQVRRLGELRDDAPAS